MVWQHWSINLPQASNFHCSTLRVYFWIQHHIWGLLFSINSFLSVLQIIQSNKIFDRLKAWTHWYMVFKNFFKTALEVFMHWAGVSLPQLYPLKQIIFPITSSYSTLAVFPLRKILMSTFSLFLILKSFQIIPNVSRSYVPIQPLYISPTLLPPPKMGASFLSKA